MSVPRLGPCVWIVALLAVSHTVTAAPAPPLLGNRYDEDWRGYCASSPTSGLDAVKCIRLPGTTLLSLGGELRERGEAFENPAFGLKHSYDHALLHRVLAFGDLRVADLMRAFVQFNYASATARPFAPSPTDVDRLDLAQAFLEAGVPIADGRLSLRGGRQELSFGSQRLLSVRDSPNIRRNFDGARLMWDAGGYRLDALYVRPVESARGTFDDRIGTSEALSGVYATRMPRLGLPTGIDVYFLEYRRDDARFALARADERRHSLGTRIFGNRQRFDWNVEGVYQFGHFGPRDISAWTIASNFGYTWPDIRFKPRFGIKMDIASGSRHPAHGTLGTFNALYPKLPYFSEANLVAPANIVDVHPDIQLAVTATVKLAMGWDVLWRETRHDAIYAPPLVAVANTAGRGSAFIGHQAIVGVDWQVDRHVACSLQVVHFESGPTLLHLHGGAVNFLAATLGYRF